MMIFKGGDYETGGLSPQEFQQRLELWNKWIAELREQNLFKDGRALQNSATQIAENDVITDGPFVETNELVTGYIVVAANDLEHARELAKGYPDFDIKGRVEIREIATFQEYDS